MSTEKQRWNYGVRDDESIWISRGEPAGDYYAFDMTCGKEVAEEIANSLNATAGIPDPEAAIKAAREALKACSNLLRNYDSGTTGGMANAKAEAALSLLNAKGER